MQYQPTIPRNIQATITLPSSKSISNRALIINALAGATLPPENLSDCDDTRVMIKALAGNDEVVDIMAAGTSMRFLTAYFSVTPGTRILTGTERMKQRPISILVDALRALGANIEYVERQGYPPLKITGTKITGNEISLPGNVSSQYISALLMIAPILGNGLNIYLKGEVISRPYINLTLQLMKEFGVNATWDSGNSLSIPPQTYRSVPYRIESDWSAASYWYQLAALADEAEITLPGLLENSYQGDRRGADVFEKLGISTLFTAGGAVLTKKERNIIHLEEDFSDIPDLAQTFAVTCALLDIPFRFTGLQTLKIKETDRIAALIAELRKLGYILRDEAGSILIWDGGRCAPEPVPVIKTYEDHRMAMAFAPAAMHIPQMRIDEPQVVTKSYPGFWEDLQQAGAFLMIE